MRPNCAASSLMVAGVMISAILAGCVGDSGPGGFELESDSLPPYDADTGAIAGVVLTTDFQPIEHALVEAEGADRSGETKADGTFLLARLAPGEYRVIVQALGYFSYARSVEVSPGSQVTVQFLIEAQPSDAAHHETFPFVGFEACQWYVGGAISHCTLPYTQAHGAARENGVNLSNYGIPPDLMPNNDKYNFTLRVNHTQVVSELIWDATSLGAQYQMLVIACGWYHPVWDECVPPGTTSTGVRYFQKVGTSPIRFSWAHPNPETLPWVMSRANVNGNLSEQQPAGVSIQQIVEMYNTAFYGAMPPEGYTAGPPDR